MGATRLSKSIKTDDAGPNRRTHHLRDSSAAIETPRRYLALSGIAFMICPDRRPSARQQ